jgi:hypothetical protein
MSITEILKNNPEIADILTINVKASDLKEFAELCVNKGRQENPEPTSPEVYLTPAQFSEALQVSLVTLWSWDKKGITKPLRIGNAKRYRRSDLEKILCNA